MVGSEAGSSRSRAACDKSLLCQGMVIGRGGYHVGKKGHGLGLKYPQGVHAKAIIAIVMHYGQVVELLGCRAY